MLSFLLKHKVLKAPTKRNKQPSVTQCLAYNISSVYIQNNPGETIIKYFFSHHDSVGFGKFKTTLLFYKISISLGERPSPFKCVLYYSKQNKWLGYLQS